MSGIVCAVVAGAIGGAVVNPPFTGGLSDVVADPLDASCTVAFLRDGSGDRENSSGSFPFSWFSPAHQWPGDSYWIRLTVNSGATPGGDATGAWLQLNSSRAWQLNRTTVGTTTGNYTAEIATDAAGANVVASVTFSMTSQVT